MTSDQDRLIGYVETWKAAVDDVVALLRSLETADWDRPTDLTGWDVRAVACHLAHIESDLAGVKQKRVQVPELAHLTSPTSVFTEMGIIARDGVDATQVVEELEAAAKQRYAALLADPPTDGKADPPRTPGKIGWNWETLLSNRVIDVWMHEQDVRRAVERPGGLAGPAAAHTVGSFAGAFPYVVGKKVAPEPGTTVTLDVAGPHPVHAAVEVDDTGRAVALSGVGSPTVALAMDLDAFVVLSGGRRPVDRVPVRVDGDEQLGRRVLEALAITP